MALLSPGIAASPDCRAKGTATTPGGRWGRPPWAAGACEERPLPRPGPRPPQKGAELGGCARSSLIRRFRPSFTEPPVKELPVTTQDTRTKSEKKQARHATPRHVTSQWNSQMGRGKNTTALNQITTWSDTGRTIVYGFPGEGGHSSCEWQTVRQQELVCEDLWERKSSP